MINTEHQVLGIIYAQGGKTSIFSIAREIGFNSDYARMICESLGRRDYIDFSALSGIAILREKGTEIGKKAAAERKNLQNITPGKFSKDSRGRLIVNY